MKIMDGTGSGVEARVGDDNRLQVRSLSEPEVVHAGELGDSYNINTGLITISANGTLLYLKNNADENFVISSVVIAEFTGITHSNVPYVTLVRNPTAGDLITDASVVSMNQNRNFGSSKTANVLAYKGKSAGTLSGGSDIAILQCSSGGRMLADLNFILPKGSSIGITVTPGISSGSASYYAAIIGYFKDDTDSQ